MSGGDWKEMFGAIPKGDLHLVEYHLQNGIDPNYQHPEFLAAPLVECIRFNQLDIAKLLLESGADPNIQEVWDKESPLSVAKKMGNKAAVALIEKYVK